MCFFGTGEVYIWVITRWIMGQNDGLFGTGEVDIGTSQDELWDKPRSFFGIMEDDISIFRKVIIWKI
jgi:hypothetical protein